MIGILSDADTMSYFSRVLSGCMFKYKRKTFPDEVGENVPISLPCKHAIPRTHVGRGRGRGIVGAPSAPSAPRIPGVYWPASLAK